MHLLAHGLGPIKDLPVPTWLFYWGGAVVLVVSFALLGFLWRQPLLARHAAGTAGAGRAQRVLLSTPLRVAVQTVSVLLFALVFATALLGDEDPFKNLAPTWIYVVFWLGLPLLSVLLRRRVARAQPVARDRRRLRLGAPAARPASRRRSRPYPERLGRWPAAVALFAFVSLELAYKDPSAPLTLAWAIAIYTRRDAVRLRDVRPRDLARARRGLRRRVRLPRADGAADRRSTAGCASAGRSPGLAGARAACPARSR